MIIPAIDLMNGSAVQLVGGKKKQLDAGDPRPIMQKFCLAGEVALIDLDAALGRGSNAELIAELCTMGRVRVGGGIRDVDTAIKWLDLGADRIILGTAARPEILRELPAERVICALDAVDGEVVVEGWQTRTGRSIIERMHELEGLVGGFMVTFVEREGRLGGTDLSRVSALLEAARGAHLTVAGGITTTDEIAQLHHLGVDAQVGMAIYTGRMHLGDAIAAPLKSDRPDGLFPTVVCDEAGRALGLAYSSRESLCEAVDTGEGVYQSRTRGLWHKGKTSGATQQLLGIDLDCDADALRFRVRQHGAGFCHRDTHTCWGRGDARGLDALMSVLRARIDEAPAGSYTRRLFDDPELLGKKLREEAGELAEATTPAEVCWEAADLMYFALVAATRAGVSLDEIERTLDQRALKVTRRPGNAKT